MIKDKVVIITGASSGIGEATAKLLASHGAKVVLGARRTDNLKRIADEIKRGGGQIVYWSDAEAGQPATAAAPRRPAAAAHRTAVRIRG